MEELEYSDDATNTLDAFLECDYVMFVEGDDDVLFWDTVFRLNSDLIIEFRPVGGVNELRPIIDKVENGDLDCLVAKDADYTRHVEGRLHHNRILHTFGYAIENTLYSAECASSVIRLWSRKDIDCTNDAREWLNNLALVTRPLFLLDFHNAKNTLEIDVGAGNCQRFMESKTSDVVCQQKVSEHIADIKRRHQIDDNDIELEPPTVDSTIHFMRGHFLQSAILRYINKRLKENGRKATVSLDALYAHAIQFLSSSFEWNSIEGRHYQTEVQKII